jgi:ABC-2 type transport system permease protein
MLGDGIAFLIWALAALAVYVAGVRIFSMRFVKDAAAIHGMGPARTKTDTAVRQMRGGVTATLIRKELRLLRRDPLLLSKIGLSLVYFVPILLVLATSGKNGSFTLPVQAMPATLTFFASTLSGALIWITVCAEDAPDLVASAPVTRRRMERAKLLAAISPVLILFIIPLLMVGVRNPVAGVLAAIGCVAGALSSCLIGIWRQAPIDRRTYMRKSPKETQIGALGQMAVAAGLSGCVSLVSYNMPWLALVAGIITLAVFGAFHKSPEARAEAA